MSTQREFRPAAPDPTPPPASPKSDDEPMDEGSAQEEHQGEFQRPAGLENKGIYPPFEDLVALFEKLEKAKLNYKPHSHARRDAEVAKLVNRWRTDTGPDLYPLVRLLLPLRDTFRRTYGLKEAKMAAAYVLALKIEKNSVDGKKLMDWKTPSDRNPGAGDFSSVAYHVIGSRSIVRESKVDVGQVNDLLDELVSASMLSSASGKKPSEATAEIIANIFKSFTPRQQKWLIRIILKDLKIGLGDNTVLNAVHGNARAYFNTCSHIRQVCWKLHDPGTPLSTSDTQVKLHQVFKPMLSHRTLNHVSITEIVKAMRKNRAPCDPNAPISNGPFDFTEEEFIIEEKVDGERIQLHAKLSTTGDVDFKYFSRRGKDYTYLYGKDQHSGSLTPAIYDKFAEGIEEVILDGEMVVWDPIRQVYLAFGSLKTFAKKMPTNDEPQPCFKAFDCLYLKNTEGLAHSLLDVKLRYRKECLAAVMPEPIPGRFEIGFTSKGSTTNDIRVALEKIIEERGEGLVLKNPDSRYILDGRYDMWTKLKPEYMDEMRESMDLLIIGAFWGQGRRGGRHASFLFGLVNEDRHKRKTYHTFCKVGTGFSLETFGKIKELTEGKWIDYDRADRPDWFVTASIVPDQYIDPAESLIVSIKASEIVEGKDYGAGFTLRFPRAIKLREDKSPGDAMRLSEMLAAKSTPGTKRTMTDDFAVRNVKRTTAARPGSKATMISSPLDNVAKIDDLFSGYTFFVNLGVEEKETIQRSIVEHGGRVMQKLPPATTTRLVVSSAQKLTNTMLLKDVDKVDIVKSSWIVDSITRKAMQGLSGDYLLHATPETIASNDYRRTRDEQSIRREQQAQRAMDAESDDTDEPADEDYISTGQEEEDINEYGMRELKIKGEIDSDDDDGFYVDSAPRAGPSRIVEEEERESSVEIMTPDDAMEEDTLPQTTGMGGDTDAMEYDPEILFDHLVFYLDTGENAVTNALTPAKFKGLQTMADADLEPYKTSIVENGGTLTNNLNDPTLTHIIVSEEVADRYIELTRRTAEPRHRKIVIAKWVKECIEDEEICEVTRFKP